MHFITGIDKILSVLIEFTNRIDLTDFIDFNKYLLELI